MRFFGRFLNRRNLKSTENVSITSYLRTLQSRITNVPSENREDFKKVGSFQLPLLPSRSILSFMASEKGSGSSLAGEPAKHENATSYVLDERRRAALAEVDNATFSCVLTSFSFLTFDLSFVLVPSM